MREFEVDGGLYSVNVRVDLDWCNHARVSWMYIFKPWIWIIGWSVGWMALNGIKRAKVRKTVKSVWYAGVEDKVFRRTRKQIKRNNLCNRRRIPPHAWRDHLNSKGWVTQPSEDARSQFGFGTDRCGKSEENGIPNTARRSIYRSMIKSVNSGITSAEWPGCGFSSRRSSSGQRRQTNAGGSTNGANIIRWHPGTRLMRATTREQANASCSPIKSDVNSYHFLDSNSTLVACIILRTTRILKKVSRGCKEKAVQK